MQGFRAIWKSELFWEQILGVMFSNVTGSKAIREKKAVHENSLEHANSFFFMKSQEGEHSYLVLSFKLY